MKRTPKFTILAHRIEETYTPGFREVGMVGLFPPKTKKWRDWFPEVGQSIPKEVLTDSDEIFDKILIILEDNDIGFFQILLKLDQTLEPDYKLMNRFSDICGKCIDAMIGNPGRREQEPSLD